MKPRVRAKVKAGLVPKTKPASVLAELESDQDGTAITNLARPGDPLIAPDGTIIAGDESGADSLDDASEITRNFDPLTYRPNRKRTVKELPAPVNVINATSLVFMYTLLGLSDREISECLRISTDEVSTIRAHTAYRECFDAVLNEFVNSNSDILQSRIAAFSHHALSRVAHMGRTSKNEAVKLSANRDILDRAGVTPKNAASRNESKNELRIVIVDAQKEVAINNPIDPSRDIVIERD